MRGGTVRAITAAGILAVGMLSALGPSMAAAFEAAEDQSSPAPDLEPIEPATKPNPPNAPPPRATPPHPTPKPKQPTPTPKPKPKPKPTPLKAPTVQVPGERSPGEQAPGSPEPVRPDEPPAAPVIPAPVPAGSEPPEGEPAAPVGPPNNQPFIGPGATPTTGGGAPLPPGLGPPSRVHLVVAGATVSGIAAVAVWLVLGGRRREQASVRALQPPATTVTLADGMQLDLEVAVPRREGEPQPRYTGRVRTAAGTTLWRDEDDRPRWLRRFDDQGPPRRRVPRSRLEPDEDATPWLTGVPWSARDEHRQN
jgi:hypothetical protein